MNLFIRSLVLIVVCGVLTAGNSLCAQTLLVPAGSVWKYLDTGTNLGTAWRATNFIDAAWAAGPAELGYGDSTDGRPERTTISYGTNAASKYITYYFRRAFTVTAPGSFTNLILGVVRDDGVVVYLNGGEIHRNNMPAGTISFTTTASTNVGGADEAVFFCTNLSPSVLRPGTNVLAVEVHQNSAGSTDLSFDLFLIGETGTPLTTPLVLYVAPNGNDDWSGTTPQPTGSDGPFATLERARDVVRCYALNGYLPPGGAVVEVGGGTYELARPLELTTSDSGTQQAPILWRARAGEEVRLLGGRRLGGFTRVTDPAALARIDPAARNRVWQTDLRAQGISNFGVLQGASSWAQSDPGLELFFNDLPMTLARWPNEGYVKIVKALGPTPVDIRGTKGTAEGIFSYDGDRPSRWVGEPDIMLEGFWFWDWADQRHKVLSIDTVSNIITVATPYHTYGYRDGQWFYAYNLLPELDQPGEWYLDRTSGRLYFWPPSSMDQGTAMVSLLPGIITVTNASFITLQGFVLEGCQGTALAISGGASNTVKACTVRNVGKNGIRIANSPGSGVTGCDIYYCGDSGVTLSGGDRPTLTPGGLYAEHNHLHHWSRWNPVYHAGITLSGVGHRVAHNLIHDAPHEGIGFGGNDHLIEFNEFHSLVSESNDAGVIYAGRTWTARGHIIRYNYFHHIYGFQRRGCNCVYLDDQFSSASIYGNLFYDVPTAVLIGGGRDNFVQNNVFVNCRRSISIDARGLGWASSAVQTLTNDLNSLPYQTLPWSGRYPQLTNILNEDPMAPRGNVVAQNICWNGGWTNIEAKALPGVTLSNNLVGTDPLFVDTNRLNFQLQDQSPAFALGFERIPLEQIGPDPNAEHAPWPPTVTLAKPAGGSVFGAPAAVVMEAIVSDPGRQVEAVEFMVGRARLGELAAFPYWFTWTNALPGNHSLTAFPRSSNATATVASPVKIRVDDALVTAGATWKYLDNGSDQGTAWRAINFNDSAWPSGPAELGYGDSADNRPEATTIHYGPDANHKYITYYFRRAFVVAAPAGYANLVLGLLRDDGAVVYLNGTEVFRSNLTNGPITYTNTALAAVGGTDETIFFQTNVSPALLRAGANVLAVEVHQANGTSTDLSFDLFLNGIPNDPLPVLEARRAGGAVELAWPLTAAGFDLLATPGLSAPGWDTVTNVPSVSAGRVGVSVETPAGNRFFRLEQP